MPLSIGQLTAKTTHSTLHLQDGALLEVEWHPARLSDQIVSHIAAIERIQKLPTAQALETLRSVADIVIELVASWDLVEEHDSPMVALTHERLSRLGLPVLWAIVLSLLQETRLDPSSGETRSPESFWATRAPASGEP